MPYRPFTLWKALGALFIFAALGHPQGEWRRARTVDLLLRARRGLLAGFRSHSLLEIPGFPFFHTGPFLYWPPFSL